jgi:hypothetical protein
MNENEIAKEIVDAAYRIHRKLGPGLLESAYETVLVFDLEKRCLNVERQVPVPIVYEGTVDLPPTGGQTAWTINQFWIRADSRRNIQGGQPSQ